MLVNGCVSEWTFFTSFTKGKFTQFILFTNIFSYFFTISDFLQKKQMPHEKMRFAQGVRRVPS